MLNTMTVQDATVEALLSLGDPALRIIVDAGPVNEPTTKACANDSLHGPGNCLLRGDELCLACTIMVITPDLVVNCHIGVEVTQ